MYGYYLHQAVVLMAPGSDPGAPGAAITVGLCGSWQHTPPCPLAAHHTDARPEGSRLLLRTVFAARPADEQEVRDRIRTALSRGLQEGPDGTASRWTVLSSSAGELTTAERSHAGRIAGS